MDIAHTPSLRDCQELQVKNAMESSLSLMIVVKEVKSEIFFF